MSLFRNRASAGEFALRTAGIVGVVTIPGKTLHLLAGLNADQYAAEMRGQLAMPPVT